MVSGSGINLLSGGFVMGVKEKKACSGVNGASLFFMDEDSRLNL